MKDPRQRHAHSGADQTGRKDRGGGQRSPTLLQGIREHNWSDHRCRTRRATSVDDVTGRGSAAAQRSAVLLRVFLLGELTPSEARQYIESLREWVEQELRSYEEIRDSNDWSDNDSDFFARVALEHLLRAARRDAEWTRWVLDELDRREQALQAGSTP
jgi:Virulence activator alpha C-term